MLVHRHHGSSKSVVLFERKNGGYRALEEDEVMER